MFHCDFVRAFWTAVGVKINASSISSGIHLLPRPSSISSEVFPTYVALCYWHLWKRRNQFALLVSEHILMKFFTPVVCTLRTPYVGLQAQTPCNI